MFVVKEMYLAFPDASGGGCVGRSRWLLLGLAWLAGCAISPQAVRVPPEETASSPAMYFQPAPLGVEASLPGVKKDESPVDPPAIREGRSVFFARRSSDISSEALSVLELHASRLRADSRLVVTLVGHSDHLGSRSYNLAIAEQRVAAVAKALRNMDVQRGQIRKYGLGSEKPGLLCQSEQCRRKLRRVDLVYPKTEVERRVGRPKD